MNIERRQPILLGENCYLDVEIIYYDLISFIEISRKPYSSLRFLNTEREKQMPAFSRHFFVGIIYSPIHAVIKGMLASWGCPQVSDAGG